MSVSRGLRFPSPVVDLALSVVVGLVVLVSAVAWWVPHRVDARRLDAIGVVLLAIIVAAVAMRRRSPLVAFAAGEVAVLAWLLLDYDGRGVLVAPIVLSYTMAAACGLWWGVGAGAVNVAAGATAIVVLFDEATAFESIGLGVSASVAAIAVGLAVRYHRAYAAAMQERLVRAEQDREAEARRRVDQERLRIARELHDVVSHSIAAIGVQAATAVHVVDRQSASAFQAREAREALVAIRQISAEAMRELRAMLGMLRSDGDKGEQSLRPAPGLDQLDDLAASVNASGVAVDVVVRGERPRLPASVQLAAYRIVQESLTNVLRHAGARQATVTVTYRPDRLELEILDDGRGNGARPRSNGHGIIGMRERAQAMGGELHAGPAADRGFQVCCWLPLGISE